MLQPRKLYYVQLAQDGVLAQDMHADIRRDKLDIILRILEVGSVPVKKTHILYKAGINFYQLSRYLDLLLKTGLMEQIEDPYIVYRTTEKGRVMTKLFSGKLEADASVSATLTKATSQVRHTFT